MKLLFILTASLLIVAGHGSTCAQQADPNAAEKYFTNTELFDQNGRRLRFYQDVMKGKVVVINTFHSDCKSTCPPMQKNFERIQDAFATHLGQDLFLVSITIDPLNDTPERLKAYAANNHARDGWLFLTGTKENVDVVLKKLGQYVEQKEDHTTIVIIGNEKTGLWKKAFGLARSQDLIDVVDTVLKDGKQTYSN